MNPRDKLPLSVKAKEFFCPLPFVQMTLKTEGQLSPCCLQQEYILGQIQNQSLKEIWNSPPIKNLRKEFISGEIKTCKDRINQYSCHKNFERFLSQIVLNEEQEQMPIRFDLRLDQSCNLRCTMCDLYLHPPSPYNENNFWKDLKEMAPFLKEIELLGGEPFFQETTTKLIEEITKVNQTCLWTITTNLNFHFKTEIKPLLDKIPLRTIAISIDSFTKETYDQIRIGGDFKLLQNSLQDLLIYQKERLTSPMGSFRISGSMCVLKNNWKEVPTFVDKCFELGIHPCFHYVVHPPHLSLNSLSSTEKEEILSYLLDYCDERRTPYIRRVLWGIHHGLDSLPE